MSFQTGLSGLNASSKNLDVIGNNIANANTVGAKASRAEFAAVVASAIGPSGGGGAAGDGIGVRVATVSQQFSQGTINITGNNLDVAVNGGGFFELTLKDGSSAYTRDGQFKLDANGNLVTNSGANVMGYTIVNGVPSSTPTKMVVPSGAPIAAKATTTITSTFNLDARAPVYNAGTNTPPGTTYGTTLNAFDSQGVAVPVKLFFTKDDALPPLPSATPNTWKVWDSDPATVPAPTSLGTVTFDNFGNLQTVVSTTPPPAGASSTSMGMNLTSPNPGVVSPFLVGLEVKSATQYGTSFAISDLTQDGYTAGTLTGVSISEQGIITTRYSNGQSQANGQLALADFRNVQGLKPVGQNNWVETSTSGQPINGHPAQGNFGTINAGSLEASNVDLTAELVAMISVQRDYQANAQTIKTQDTVLQTLVNLR
ncbi:MAG: flagellar hook protein FlgE [Burkholderiales bacterium]|nr:flagellar hook protein FlgE [Burkholderiales bacterium]